MTAPPCSCGSARRFDADRRANALISRDCEGSIFDAGQQTRICESACPPTDAVNNSTGCEYKVLCELFEHSRVYYTNIRHLSGVVGNSGGTARRPRGRSGDRAMTTSTDPPSANPIPHGAHTGTQKEPTAHMPHLGFDLP